MPFDPWIIPLLLLAPLPFWLAGLPMVTGTAALRLAPVFGMGLVGWYAELGLMTGIPASIAILIGLLASVVLLAFRRPSFSEIYTALREGYLFYLLALLPAVISPFPILGIWSGDWLIMHDTGQAVMAAAPFDSDMLARPPLGGAMTIPLLFFKNTLWAFQLCTTVASAGLLATFWHGYRYLGGRLPLTIVMIPIAGSLFFLHHTAAAWVKPLAAALVLTSIVLGLQSRRDGHGWWRTAVAFALAVAAHQSSILYGGFIVVLAASPWDRLTLAFKRLAIVALAGILIVAVYEAWSVRVYGWEAKKNANPAVSQRIEEVSFAKNTSLVMLSSVIPWSPIEIIERLLKGPRNELSKNLYWLATDWLTIGAGTFLGLLLPWVLLLVAQRGDVSQERPRLFQSVWGWFLAGILAFVGNAVLNPFYSPAGSAQTGLVPLECFVLLFLLLTLDTVSSRIRKGIVILTLVLSTLPFIAINSGVSAGLKYSSTFREQFTQGSEGDWKDRIIPRKLEPLGLMLFPAGTVIIGLSLIVLWVQSSRSGKARES